MAGVLDNLVNQIKNPNSSAGDSNPSDVQDNSGVANNSSSSDIIKPSSSILEWEAPERVFKRKPREFFRKIAVIMMFFALMLLIIKDFLFIAVLAVIFFVVYVFNTVPPRNVVHKIRTNGIDYASEHIYTWDQLKSFYIEKRDNTHFLIVDTVQAFPGRLLLILSDKVDRAELSKTLNEYLSINENPEPNMFDSIVDSMSRKLNI